MFLGKHCIKYFVNFKLTVQVDRKSLFMLIFVYLCRFLRYIQFTFSFISMIAVPRAVKVANINIINHEVVITRCAGWTETKFPDDKQMACIASSSPVKILDLQEVGY